MVWPTQMGDSAPGDMECGRRLLPWKQVGSYFWGQQSVGGQCQTDGRKVTQHPHIYHCLQCWYLFIYLIIMLYIYIFVQSTGKSYTDESNWCLGEVNVAVFFPTVPARILLQLIPSKATVQNPLQSHFYFDIMWGCSTPSGWFNGHARQRAKEPCALRHKYLVK